MVPAIGFLFRQLQFSQPLDRPAGNEESYRGAVSMFQKLTVLRPGENGIGMERLFDRRAFVVVEGSGPRRGGRWRALVVALGPLIQRLRGQAGFDEHAASVTPVHSLALRIIPSLGHEGL